MKKWKLVTITTIIIMSSTFAGFEFYPEIAAASKDTEVRSGAVFILDEVPEIPDTVSHNSRAVEETTESESETDMETSEIMETVEETQIEESLVGTLIIADVTNYVNIRSMPSEEGEVLGKLYDNSVGTLLALPEEWLFIESGSVQGYVKAEYVLTGEQAKDRADEVGKRLAEVTTTTLRVREEPSTESVVLGLIPGGDILAVLEETDGWIKVSIEEGEGYVSTEFLNVYTENVKAESAEEERIRLEKEEAERKKAEEAARKAIREKEAAAKAKAETSNKKTQSTATTVKQETSVKQDTNTKQDVPATDSDLGRKIADYGLQFVGNPYVYGGTSLTKGTDCSGFVMSVYAHFGISLPRTSGEQGKSGVSVGSIDNAQAGDLVWYSGHIAIYTGNGKVVHASNAKEGIKTSNADYRKILGVRRII